jgi:hypothetical protein
MTCSDCGRDDIAPREHWTDALHPVCGQCAGITSEVATAELERLRAIEAAAVAYRDAKNALRLAMIRGDDSGALGRAAAATETALFCLLTPQDTTP